MKTKYNQPIVEVIGLKSSCALLAGSAGSVTPTFDNNTIQTGGEQIEAR